MGQGGFNSDAGSQCSVHHHHYSLLLQVIFLRFTHLSTTAVSKTKSPTILLHFPSPSFFLFQRGADGTSSTNLRASEQLSEGDSLFKKENTFILFTLLPRKRSELGWVFLNIKKDHGNRTWIHIFQGKQPSAALVTDSEL